MMKKRGFTLVEILVVVSIIALVAGLTIPAIKAMQAGSARAEAYNTINAALQGVRSYAIMNNVKAAARFQPNGKVVFVYRIPRPSSMPAIANPDGDFIYLPVLDQEPLRMPNGYSSGQLTRTTGSSGLDESFFEPFYVCYNPDGTLAVQEKIYVALIDDTTNDPINLNLDGGNPSWRTSSDFDSYSDNLSDWLDFIKNKDGVETDDIDDRKLARFFFVAESDNDRELIFETGDLGIDHYAGMVGQLSVDSISSFAIFRTPENWNKWPLFVDDMTESNPTQTKTKYVQDELTEIGQSGGVNPDLYETIFINPYTGRLIRPNH